MDALSDVLAAVRLSAGAFLHAEFTAPWCIRAQVGVDDCRVAGLMPAQLMAYHYVLDGRLLVMVGAAAPLQLTAGEIILLPRNEPHILASAAGLRPQIVDPLIRPPQRGGLAQLRLGGGGAPTRLICGFLGCEVADNPLVQSLPRTICLRVADSPAGAWVEQSFRLAAEESASPRLGSATVLGRLAELLFIEALRRYLEELPPGQRGWLAGLRDPQVGRALGLLHSRPATPWTTETLAREVGLSRSAFAAHFARLIGQPPMRYLARWRLQLAAAQLRDGHSLAQIAYGIGYGSEAALNRAFRQHYGMPPGAWRKRHAGGAAPV